MRVLFLAPQPFYQERGTPIAIRIALESLVKRIRSHGGEAPRIDILCYAEGEDIDIPGVTIVRIPSPRFLRGIRPGISLKKLLCDIIFLFKALALVFQNRKNQYSVLHAVEEAVFIAWLVKKIWGIPYIYDMDSSLSSQLTEKWWWCKPLYPVLNFFEGVAVRESVAVAPVCDALSIIATKHGSPHTVILRDVSLLPSSSNGTDEPTNILGLPLNSKQPIILYVGNLEFYQGIDLLLESFALVRSHHTSPLLVIIGGPQTSVEHYQTKARALACAEQISFLGPRPVANLRAYLSMADILVSPRIKGNNTPMKIYSYLHSGRALVATDLPTHHQVLDDEIAVLAPSTPQGFSEGLLKLLDNPSYRKEIGERAQARAERLYTLAAFETQLVALYEEVSNHVAKNPIVLQEEA